MRRLTLIYHLLVVNICCLLTSFAYGLELSPQEKTWLSQHVVIRVGIDPAWPPYEFVNQQQQYTGISADYMALISQRLGIRFEVTKDKSWTEVKELLEQKKLDISPSVAETPQRRLVWNFTQPYISFPVVILTRVDDAFIGQLEDLQGQRVGVEANYFADEVLQKNFPKIQRVPYANIQELLSALALKRIDYAVTNHASASYTVQHLQITGIKLAAVTPFESPLTIAVRNDWPEFVAILNKALADISPQEHQTIRQRWLAVHKQQMYFKDVWRLHPDVVLLVMLGSVLLFMLAVIIYFRQRLLNRQAIAQRAQQDLAESEKRFRVLIEHAPVAFAIFKGKVGIIKMLNRSFIRTFGYRPNELHDVEDWWRVAYPNPSYREKIQTLWFERFEAAKTTHQPFEPMEAMVCCRDGTERYIRFHAILIGSFNLVAFIDLTEQKHNQEALLKAKETAEQATKAKSLFLANMSHEIRTPMNGILGLAVLLEKTELNERQRDYLSKIYSSGEFLLGILNDILDLSKVEAGKLELERQPFTVAQLLEPLRGLVLSATQHKPVETLFYVTPDVPTMLMGDLLRFNQVLTNLLGNAIKFSAKGEIEIGITAMPTTQADKIKLHLWVRDTGIGMSSEQLGKVFEAFSQADASTTRRFGGTGLGLTISKRIVELMDGEIKVQSQPNQGSRFDIFVYVSPSTEQQSIATKSTTKRSILILDDNQHAALAIKSIAERLQWQVDILTALNEHSQIVATHYDYILLDADFATEEYSRYLPSDVPKVLLQTPWQENDPMLGSMIDFTATLTKPIDEQTLLSLITTTTDKNITIEEKPLLAYRILLVEDNTINQLVGVKLLETLGAEVDVAENGHVALSLLQQVGVYYDVVLMDLQMPIMDGLETTRQLRLIEQFADLPVIAMTANVMATDREACFEAGMNDFMSKPIRLQELRTKVLQWVKTP